MPPRPRSSSRSLARRLLPIVLAARRPRRRLRGRGPQPVAFDPTAPCTDGGPAARRLPGPGGAAPDRDRGQGARHRRLRAAAARPGPWARSRTPGSRSCGSPAATWGPAARAAGRSPCSRPTGLDPVKMRDVLPGGRRGGPPHGEGASRPTRPSATCPRSAWTCSMSDGTGQTVVAWQRRRRRPGLGPARRGPRRHPRGGAARGPRVALTGAALTGSRRRLGPVLESPDHERPSRRLGSAPPGLAHRAPRSPRVDRLPERRDRFVTLGDIPVEGLYGPWDLERDPDAATPRRPTPTTTRAPAAPPLVDHHGDPLRDGAGRYADADLARDLGLPGRAAVHPRRPPDGLPLAALDDAHVRGLRQRRGHQRPVPPAARRRPDRPLDRLRHAHALRLRHRRPRGRGRVRDVRRRGQQPRRHGGPARRACRSTGSAPR